MINDDFFKLKMSIRKFHLFSEEELLDQAFRNIGEMSKILSVNFSGVESKIVDNYKILVTFKDLEISSELHGHNQYGEWDELELVINEDDVYIVD